MSRYTLLRVLLRAHSSFSPDGRHPTAAQGYALPMPSRQQGVTLWARLRHCFAFFLTTVVLLTSSLAQAGVFIDDPAELRTANLGTSSSNENIVTLLGQLRLMRYAPGNGSATNLNVQPTQCSAGGGVLPGPLDENGNPLLGSVSTPVATSLPLIDAGSNPRFSPREPIFVYIRSAAANLSTTAVDTLTTTVQITLPDSSVVNRNLVLTETGSNSADFVGYLVQANTGPCTLQLEPGSTFTLSYNDSGSSTETESATGIINPYAFVFDAATGAPIDGARITIERIGGTADARGDDGNADFPEIVFSGTDTLTPSGKNYPATPGSYRYPQLPDGQYRLIVQAPAGYRFPSTTSAAVINTLPGAPWSVDIGDTASRGGNFTVAGDWPRRIDIPLDPATNTDLFLTKRALRETVAVGDFLQYQIDIENPAAADANNVIVRDALPMGFRYVARSMRTQNGTPLGEPTISADGSAMQLNVGTIAAGTTLHVRYVVEISAGARQGDAVNSAQATGDNGVNSNTAKAAVRVREDLMRSESILVGRVIVGSCDGDPTNDEEGLADVRLYMDNGMTVVTDEHGRWHIAGIRPGTHVIQVDKASIDPDYELENCDDNTRRAGSNFSQFVDIQGGGLWRADFYVKLKEGKQKKTAHDNSVTQRLASESADDGVLLQLVATGYSADISDTEALLQLSPGLDLVADSMTIHDEPVQPTADGEGRWHINLGAMSGNWVKFIAFKVKPGTYDGQANWVSNKLRFRNARGETVETATAENRYLLSNEDDSAAGSKLELTQFDSGELSTDVPAAIANKKKDKISFGITNLTDGQIMADRISAVRVVLDARLTPKLLLDDIEIPAGQIGFRSKDEKNGVAIFSFIGVDFGSSGPHRLFLQGVDAFGNPRFEQEVNLVRTGAVRKIALEDTGTNIADGKTPVVIKAHLLDEQLRPIIGSAELKLLSGTLVPEPANDPSNPLSRPKGTVSIGADGTLRFQPVTESGRYRLKLAWGEHIQQSVDVMIKPHYRDWIMVGFAEGSMGYRTLNGNKQGLNASDAKENLTTDGKVSFFARGKVKGEWLLTVAYDSGKPRGEGPQNVIDPNAWYTLYGDATQQDQEAPSLRKLYLKMERNQFYFLFGDYDTGLSVTELSNYQRRLNGVKSEYYDKKLDAMVFASETSQGFVRDELRGNGTSGIYRLRVKPLVPGSESIRVETRDRYHSQTVIDSRDLSRFLDYSIDYNSGAVWFKEPILAHDENLNPVFIVVEYETDTGLMDTTGGARVVLHARDNVDIGMTLVEEGGSNGRLAGADATIDLDARNRIVVEAANTDSNITATPGNIASQMSGSGNAYLLRHEYNSEKLATEAWVREQEMGFGLGQQPTTEGDTRKVGATARYQLDKELSLNGEISNDEQLSNGNTRTLIEGRINVEQEDRSYYGGLRSVHDEYTAQSTTRQSDQLIAGLRRQLMDKKLELGLSGETNLGGDINAVDYPNRLLGSAEYRLTTTTTLFATQEFNWGEEANEQKSRAGLRLRPWSGGQLTSALGRQTNEAGDRVYAEAGLLQNWQLTMQWSADAGFDRVQTLSNQFSSSLPTNAPVAPLTPMGTAAADLEDYTALFTGAGYDDGAWSWRGRIETRFGELDNRYGLTSGIYHELDAANTMAGTLRVNLQDFDSGDAMDDATLGFGWAYRPLRDRWILLDQLDLVWEKKRDAYFALEGHRIVNNFNSNVQIDERNQLGMQYAAKYVLDTIDSTRYTGYTDIVGLEFRHDLTREWDVGARTSILHSWRADQRDESYGVFVGWSPMDNVWISLGWNFKGYRDADFSGAQYRDEGLNLAFRIKFDQDSVKNAYQRYRDNSRDAQPAAGN